MGKIYIICDSFGENASQKQHSESGIETFWVDIFHQSFSDMEVQNFSVGSQDLQTILDVWIKLLPEITEDDILIVCSPYYSRYRFPLNEHCYTTVGNITTRHIGQHGGYNILDNELEFFDETYDRDALIEKTHYNQIINSSKASTLNYKEIIESLLKLTKCKSLLFSWTRFKDGYKPHTLKDKGDLEQEIEYWGTQSDEYIRTNGKYGILNDFHWNATMHRKFAEYAIKIFKK